MKPNPKRIELEIPRYRQWTGFSCGPVCLRILLKVHFGPRISPWKAISECEAWPEGVSVEKLDLAAQKLSGGHGCLKQIHRRLIRGALRNGRLVLATASRQSGDDHFVIIHGISGVGMYMVHDPILPLPLLNSQSGQYSWAELGASDPWCWVMKSVQNPASS